MSETKSYRFDRFTVDCRSASLRREGIPLPLRPKSFDVLVYLVRNPGRLVPKGELIDNVWQNVIVTENSLAQCIREIRQALRDDAQAILKTVSKRGYLFACPVVEIGHADADLRGPPPSPAPERRLTAILAADVAGYSRLMGEDEEGTLAQLKAHRRALVDPKINEHRGRIVKTSGDGMLVEFASVVDAVRCAVDVQRSMAEREITLPQERRIRFRVG